MLTPLELRKEYCYDGRGPNEEPRDEVCIQGGIIVWDTYNDHLSDERAGDSDQWVKFVFRGGETEKRLTFKAKPDDCITPDRTIRVAVNTVFDDLDDYGYIIDETEHTVHVNGDDTTNGELFENGGKCLPVDDGATEEIIQNRAPEFSSLPITLSVVENTDADVNIGDPVAATDPEGDELTFSLTGTDAASFDIDSSTGQLMTDAALDYETKTPTTWPCRSMTARTYTATRI